MGYILGAVSGYTDFSFEPTQSPPSTTPIPGYAYAGGMVREKAVVHENGLLVCGGSESASDVVK